jgi:hypothetical protein
MALRAVSSCSTTLVELRYIRPGKLDLPEYLTIYIIAKPQKILLDANTFRIYT